MEPGMKPQPAGWPRLLANSMGMLGLCLGVSGCDSQALNWPAALLSSLASPLQVQPGDTLLGWAAADGLDPPFGMTAWVSAARLFPWMDGSGLLQQQQFGLLGSPMFPNYTGSFYNQNTFYNQNIYGSSLSAFVTLSTGSTSSTLLSRQATVAAVPAPFSVAGMIVGIGLSRRLRARIQSKGRSRRWAPNGCALEARTGRSNRHPAALGPHG